MKTTESRTETLRQTYLACSTAHLQAILADLTAEMKAAGSGPGRIDAINRRTPIAEELIRRAAVVRAAAPDMLAVLQCLVADMDDIDGNCSPKVSTINAARAAIQAATGGAK